MYPHPTVDIHTKGHREKLLAAVYLKSLWWMSWNVRAVMEVAATERRHPSQKKMQKLTAKAREGDAYLTGLFTQAGRVVGYGIANLMALMSPERVVVTGPGIRAYDLMEAAVHEGIEEALVPELVGQAKVEAWPWSEEMTGQGIITLALRHFRQGEVNLRPQD